MKHLAYIDDYFKATDKSSLALQFDQRLKEEPGFAEEVAFYLTTIQVLKEQVKAEKLERFRAIWKLQEAEPDISSARKTPVRSLWRYAAAAAVLIGFVLVAFLWFKPASKEQLADHYIQDRFNTLGVSMGGGVDSMQLAKDFYNQGKLAEALSLLETIATHNSHHLSAIEFAGVANLRLKRYDKALDWFKQLASYKTYNNPGIFYQALTLMKRNQPGDLPAAKTLLQQVVDQNLAEKETARQWLDKW